MCRAVVLAAVMLRTSVSVQPGQKWRCVVEEVISPHSTYQVGHRTGIQMEHPGTQLSTGFEVWACLIPQIFYSYLEHLQIIQTMDCSGWKSFKNSLFQENVVTCAFR